MTKNERLSENAKRILESIDVEKIPLPKEFNDYLINEIFEDMRFLFMHREKGKKYGYCTHCNKEMIIDDSLRHNDTVFCKNCHSKVICKDRGRGRSNLFKSVEVAVAQNLPSGGTLIRQYSANFSFTSVYKNVTPDVRSPYFWGYFEPNYYATFQKTWYRDAYFSHTTQAPSFLKVRLNDKRINKDFALYGFEELTKGDLKYCPIDLYVDKLYDTRKYNYNLFRFMQFYCEYPTLAEKLCKEGFAALLIERLEYNSTGGINLKAKTVSAALGANKKELKQFKELCHPSLHMVKTMQFLKKYDIKTSKENHQFIGAIYSLKDMKLCMKYATFNEIKKITKRQSSLVINYKDYLEECIELNFDMTCKSVIVPQNLQVAHERTSALIYQKKNKAEFDRLRKLDEAFQKKLLPQYIKKHSFESGDYFIRPAESSEELRSEGNALGHCVGSYANKYLTGKTIILFIRKKSEPNNPFYTLELNDNIIIQCRTAHNHTYKENDTIVTFIEQWKTRNKKPQKSINVA